MHHRLTRRIARWAAAALLAAPLAAAAANQYGAIAFNKQTLSYGYSYNQPTRVAAENRAMNECGGGCTPMMWYANGCGVLATSKERYGAGSGPTRAEATRLAHERCGKGCRTLVTSCTDRPKK